MKKGWTGRVQIQSEEKKTIRLLSRDLLLKTGPVDHADWNFRPFIGSIQKLRFSIVTALLPRRRLNNLLEVGYGSGIFLPELARNTEHVHGVDIHDAHDEVTRRLAQYGVKATLQQASMELLPYDDHQFDCIVAVSSLEFVENIASATREIARTLRPDGRFIVITPGRSVLLDFGLKILTGECASKDFEDRREKIVPTLLDTFTIDREVSFPRFSGPLSLYRAFSLRKAEVV